MNDALLGAEEDSKDCESSKDTLSYWHPEHSIFRRIPDQQNQQEPADEDSVHHVHVEVHVSVDLRHLRDEL